MWKHPVLLVLVGTWCLTFHSICNAQEEIVQVASTTYPILIKDGKRNSVAFEDYRDDLVSASDALATQVAIAYLQGRSLEEVSDSLSRRSLAVMVETPGDLALTRQNLRPKPCPKEIGDSKKDLCETVEATVRFRLTGVQADNPDEVYDSLRTNWVEGIAQGRLQSLLELLHPNSPVTVLTGDEASESLADIELPPLDQIANLPNDIPPPREDQPPETDVESPSPIKEDADNADTAEDQDSPEDTVDTPEEEGTEASETTTAGATAIEDEEESNPMRNLLFLLVMILGGCFLLDYVVFKRQRYRDSQAVVEEANNTSNNDNNNQSSWFGGALAKKKSKPKSLDRDVEQMPTDVTDSISAAALDWGIPDVSTADSEEGLIVSNGTEDEFEMRLPSEPNLNETSLYSADTEFFMTGMNILEFSEDMERDAKPADASGLLDDLEVALVTENWRVLADNATSFLEAESQRSSAWSASLSQDWSRRDKSYLHNRSLDTAKVAELDRLIQRGDWKGVLATSEQHQRGA